ncbi:single-stranded DNA-binding protein [Paraburkholderia sp. A1RO-5L]|uniref:single-stranded DNA-binding protein n=1 Tax=unclassified Paraburkholderia TaxID=2615204 RepID=UPI003B77BC57
MLDALVSGKLYGTAQSRTGHSGKTFVVAKVRAASGDGESLFVNVIAFDDKAKVALLALQEGDSIALAGTLTPRVWTDKHGENRPALDMTAHAVLTPYHARRKRETIAGANPAARAPAARPHRGLREAQALYGACERELADDDLGGDLPL